MQKITKKLKTLKWRIASFGAKYYYGDPSSKLKIIGVTGTNGKTTTTTLLYKVATALGYKAGLIGTVENIIAGERRDATHTTPDSISLTKLLDEMVQAGCKYVFMEVSSHALDQNRVWGINFTGAVFTNLTHDHLDYHKNLENYFSAKKRLFEMLPASAFALTNADDEHGLEMVKNIKAKKHTYGLKHQADFNEKIETSLLGSFNEYNALATYATAVLLGEDKEKVREALKNVTSPRGRFEHFLSPLGVLVVIDYAHTPDALEKILIAVNELKKEGRVISLFGCGGDRDPMKRSKMGKIGAELSDIAIFTSDNPRGESPDKIIEEMKFDLSPDLLQKVKIIADRREAILESLKLAQKGDIILCAGKGHETYQEVKGVKSHFDDREEFEKSFQQK